MKSLGDKTQDRDNSTFNLITSYPPAPGNDNTKPEMQWFQPPACVDFSILFVLLVLFNGLSD